MPPNAASVRRIARETLGPGLADLGFRLTASGRPAWRADVEGHPVAICLQFSKWNGGASSDPFEFTVELEVGGDRPLSGARLWELLDAAERDEHRRLQNLVIAKVQIDEEAIARLPPVWQADRLAQVAPRLAPYPPDMQDVWFKYLDATDVERWMEFIRRVLPSALSRLLRESVGA